MECQWRISVLQKLGEHLIHVLLLVYKYHDGTVFVPLSEQLQQPIKLLAFIKNLHKLSHVRCCSISFTNRNLYRFLQNLAGQCFNMRWQSRTEHCNLLVRSGALKEHSNLWLEAHVKHPVGLIKHEESDTTQVGDLSRRAGKHINKTSRSSDQKFSSFLQRRQLLPHWPTTVCTNTRQVHCLAERVGFTLNLQRQLPCRCNDKANGTIAVAKRRLVHDVPDERQQVCYGLSRASLRNTYNISSTHQRRHGLHLNGKWCLVVALFQDLQNLLRQATLEKTLHGMRASLAPNSDVAVGPPEILDFVVFHVGNLLHLNVQVFPKRLVLYQIMVDSWQGFLCGEAFDKVKVRLHLLFARLLTPVWITVHPISITFAESVFGTLLGGFSFGLSFSFFCLAALPPLLLLCFNFLFNLHCQIFCSLVSLRLVVEILITFIICIIWLTSKIFIKSFLRLTGSSKIRQRATGDRVGRLLRLFESAEGPNITIVSKPFSSSLEDKPRSFSQKLL
mmetsp:Transcript_32016/g.69077  ORF Transcript_32016/g.69077 Transcript_32016/m.69077 type:complete len:504 (-) Transcript_32016:562-2073(-)